MVPDFLTSTTTSHNENRKKTRSYGLIIYSRFPILKYGELDYPAISKLNTTIWADVLIHGDTIRLFSTHLQSNQLTQRF